MMPATKCPKCNNSIAVKPTRVLKNQVFTIEAYECDRCHSKFKVTT